MDYAIPRADDLPSIPVALEEHRSIINELGIKGVGESGAIPGRRPSPTPSRTRWPISGR